MKAFVEILPAIGSTDELPPKKYHCLRRLAEHQGRHAEGRDLATAYFAWQRTRLLAETAEVLGKPKNAKKYAELLRGDQPPFNNAYVGPEVAGLRDTPRPVRTCWPLQTTWSMASVAKSGGPLFG